MKIITGGVTRAKGFEAAGVEANIKYQGRTDMAVIYSEKPCVAAGTFTTNVAKAAPVVWDQKIVKESDAAQAIIVNSGIANACTGAEGYGYCKDTATLRQKNSAFRRSMFCWVLPALLGNSFQSTGFRRELRCLQRRRVIQWKRAPRRQKRL